MSESTTRGSGFSFRERMRGRLEREHVHSCVSREVFFCETYKTLQDCTGDRKLTWVRTLSIGSSSHDSLPLPCLLITINPLKRPSILRPNYEEASLKDRRWLLVNHCECQMKERVIDSNQTGIIIPVVSIDTPSDLTPLLHSWVNCIVAILFRGITRRPSLTFTLSWR